MTGMDALVHAIGCLYGVGPPCLPTLNLQAIRMVAANLRKAYANGENREAEKALASCLAGMAFSSTQNGRPCSGSGDRWKISSPHGLLTAFIPWVMEYNLWLTRKSLFGLPGWREHGWTP